jgi:hypothetical protein
VKEVVKEAEADCEAYRNGRPVILNATTWAVPSTPYVQKNAASCDTSR